MPSGENLGQLFEVPLPVSPSSLVFGSALRLLPSGSIV